MLNKIGRALTWILTHTLLITFGSIGMFYKVVWCENIFLFFIWLTILVTIITVGSKDLKLSAQKRGWSVPKYFSVFIDLVIVCMLAAAGRFFSAGMWFFQMALEFGIHEIKIEEGKNEKTV